MASALNEKKISWNRYSIDVQSCHIPLPKYLKRSFLTAQNTIGYFLVMRKLLLVSYCVVVWMLFSVFLNHLVIAPSIRNTKKVLYAIQD